MKKRDEFHEGMGWLLAGTSILMAWGLLALLGSTGSPVITFYAIGYGGYKAVKNAGALV